MLGGFSRSSGSRTGAQGIGVLAHLARAALGGKPGVCNNAMLFLLAAFVWAEMDSGNVSGKVLN